MTTFAVQRGAHVVCSWEFDSGRATVSDRYPTKDGVVIVGESDRLGFVLRPAEDGVAYRIMIGDVPLIDLLPSQDDAEGASMGGNVFWRESAYFESARGLTAVTLESRAEGDAEGAWRVCSRGTLYVTPTKLGEERYLAMAGDLESLSRGLLVDLYGKSNQTSDIRLAAEGAVYRLPAEELMSIERLLESLTPTLIDIGRRPASRIRSELRIEPYWGTERLSPSSLADLSRRGVSLTHGQRPARIRRESRRETFDVPEHRVIRAILEIVAARAWHCQEIAINHAQAIERERGFRDVRSGPGPSLYEIVDMPRIRRLGESGARARRAESLARSLMDLPYLRESPAELPAIRAGVFERSADYHRTFSLVRAYLLTNAIWFEGDTNSNITKLTSRLFEQWCYLRVVEAFRAAGLDLREWTGVLRQHLRSRFLLDFERGLAFEGELGGGLRVRIRYEPWILGEPGANAKGETLCRGASSDTPWSPDIVVECLRREADEWRAVYAVVLDSKYVPRITSAHWEKTAKYLEIRRAHDRRQVVRQLWLIAPGLPEHITCEDPAVAFGDSGPSCAPDETVRYCMNVVPELPDSNEPLASGSPFLRMARGTLAFFRREFGAATGL
ncbi:MAG: DUF2357 domain-containing protein [Phycisphaerales bacterium]